MSGLAIAGLIAARGGGLIGRLAGSRVVRIGLLVLAAYAYGQMTARNAVRVEAAAQTAREATANQVAGAQAARTVVDLQVELARLNKIIKENRDAAQSDPRADACGLSVDSVRRIDRVR